MYDLSLNINFTYGNIINQYYPKIELRDILFSLKRLQVVGGWIFVKLIKELFIIMLFAFLGELLSLLFLNVMVIPGSVIGMVLLFLALHYKIVPMKSVEDVGTWLTNNMGIFFVPAGVGLMANFDTLADTWWQLLLIIVITTALMMAFVGRVVQSLKRKFDKKVLQQMEHNLEEKEGETTHVD